VPGPCLHEVHTLRVSDEVLPAGKVLAAGGEGIGFQVSETAQLGPETGASRGPGAGAGGSLGGSLRHGLGAFVRQREATVFVVAVLLFIFFALERSAFLGKANMVDLFSERNNKSY